MNKMAIKVAFVNKIPFLLTFIFRKIIPYTGTSSIKYRKMTENEVVTSLENKRSVRNHIGQIHASAMVLLAETATGTLVGMNVLDTCIPLCKSLNVSFVRRSSGSMQAVATLTQEQINYIKSTEKGEVVVSVIVTDETAEEPIKCEAIWAWIPKNKLTK